MQTNSERKWLFTNRYKKNFKEKSAAKIRPKLAESIDLAKFIQKMPYDRSIKYEAWPTLSIKKSKQSEIDVTAN